MSTNTQTVKFCTFKEGNISLNLNYDDWMKGVLRGLADKYDVDARDLYFTQKQKIVSDDAKVLDVLRNTGETIYLVKRKPSAGAEGTATENEKLLPRVEENLSPELRSSKPFTVSVTVCNNEMKGKAVAVENVKPDTEINEFVAMVFGNLHMLAGYISIVSEMGAKCSGIWRRGRFEHLENSEEKYVSKLTYCGQSGLSCCIYQLIIANCLQEQASSSTPSSATPSSSSNPSNVGTEAAEQNGSQTLTLQIDYGQGNKMFIEAEKEMLVEELKKVLEPAVGITSNKMTLVGGGTIMDNDRKISSFCFKDKDRLYAYEKNEGMFEICIRKLSGKTLKIDVNSEMTVKDLKERIYEYDNTPPYEQKLTFNGKNLEDDRTLSSYNIQEDAIIPLVLRLPGGKSNDLFVKSLGGQTLRFGMDTAVTRVRDVKQMVAEREGIPVEQQRLVWGLKELRDEMELSEYGIGDKCTMHLVLKLRGGFNLRVMHLDGQAVDVEVDGAESVEDVKRKVTAVERMDVSKMRLVSGGRWLKDCHVLEDFGIGPESTVHLLPTSRGGMSGPGLAFVDVTKTDALVEISFSNTAPPWRVVGSGISVEGICENEGCPAFKKQVICRWGMKKFDLHGSKPFCPCCLEQIVPLKPGFYDCRWRVNCVKEDGTRMQMPWKEAGDEKYTTYDEKEAGTAKFLLLQIEALPSGRVVKHPTLPYDVAVPEVCGICHKGQDKNSVQIYKCGHSFHRNCGSDWEETVGECPICRMKMKDQPAQSA
ncbi:putative polyubiquitin [Monocercomonoides exilis]|uniref:putative polyubiquitin n=1 Tax=Monocercomonoides exilis TaxID=2049356 RepID=UPI00355941EE|nr:putative polyubiquitin [Monocercomonoides exilis]|eukprot:MONOS_1184.1-p1 / transcript=MONOS_1184.1 / gene=MONOS_1184 / organism=Monocercomonoides_exilis_PA203 / gene_product=polyubiquitin / transcript_product=polyubiquitin / location=Mono_scaffold00020:80867-83210(-) / protein_length=760 / sequence_SO=supercontig / SO=protein_coding / is_pseudo=false